MDPFGARVGPEDPLRTLFHEGGHHAAPAGLEARVLEQLATTTVPLHRQTPLIAPKGWAFATALLVLVGLAGLLSAAPAAQAWTGQVPGLSLEPYVQACQRFISAPWMASMALGVVMAMLMERLFALRGFKVMAR